MAKKADMQAFQDMNATLNTKNTKLKENVDSLTDTLTDLRNEIKVLKDPLSPKNWWQIWISKNISGQGNEEKDEDLAEKIACAFVKEDNSHAWKSIKRTPHALK